MRHGPDASVNATPNFINGEVPARISYKSSAVLMKWVWPRMILAPSGIFTRTVLKSIGSYSLLESDNDTPLHREGPSIARPHCNRRSASELLRRHGWINEGSLVRCRSVLCRLVCPAPKEYLDYSVQI